MKSIISTARAHFKKSDPKFFGAIKDIKILDFEQHHKGDAYHALIRAIMGQQLSVKASQTIYDRFIDLFETDYPDPEALVDFSDELLRSKGVSRQKAGYVRNVAQFFLKNKWQDQQMTTLSDEVLIRELTSIKGVGVWTVQMVLMFTLNRPDIFPGDDLGIQNAMKSIYNLHPKNSRHLKSKMTELSLPWSPYRTVGCMYLWRYTDGGEPIK